MTLQEIITAQLRAADSVAVAGPPTAAGVLEAFSAYVERAAGDPAEYVELLATCEALHGYTGSLLATLRPQEATPEAEAVPSVEVPEG